MTTQPLPPTPPALDFLLQLRIQAAGNYRFDSPEGGRMAASIVGGSFTGPRMRGRVEPFGEDLAEVRPGDVVVPDVRAVLTTDDGAQVLLQYTGLLHPFSKGLGGAPIYWRTLVRITTNAPAYAWLNARVAIGSGRFEGREVVYDLWAID